MSQKRLVNHISKVNKKVPKSYQKKVEDKYENIVNDFQKPFLAGKFEFKLVKLEILGISDFCTTFQESTQHANQYETRL